MLTLDKFEEAAEIVKKVTQETKLVSGELITRSVPFPRKRERSD